MDEQKVSELIERTALAALASCDEAELLEGFCRRAVDAGLPLLRVLIGLDTLHPVFEGCNLEWHRERGDLRQRSYARAWGTTQTDLWFTSPFYHMLETDQAWLHRRFDVASAANEFPIFEELIAEGATDYLAALTPFQETLHLRDMDGMYSSWTTDRAGGFTDQQMAVLRRLVPQLGLVYKVLSMAQIGETLVTTYLGKDAGRRVLDGNIERGVAEKISAVLWLSDLRGFTRIAGSIPGEQIVPFLSNYNDALVTAVHAHEGEVLKFIGDGLLAIFQAGDMAEACQRSIAAADHALAAVIELNVRRRRESLPVTDFALALHQGEVFYGNVGSLDRLDFTVVGAAVNEVARIEAMCRALERDVILSADFAAAARHSRERLVSLGRYALRGVRRPQELFTLVDAENGDS
jgi:adenylate cyclase